MNEEKFTRETVLSVRRWSDNLFSFVLTRPTHFRFTAGQFARIGIEVEEQQIFRAYSMVSSPFAEQLEFFSIVVPDGAFTSRLQHLQPGDQLLLEKVPYGFLTLARYQKPLPQDLWLLATGTGLAPFLSMLQDFEPWQQYQQIILAYSVRCRSELAYEHEIAQLAQDFGEGGARFTFLPIITRETGAALNQRLPVLIANGQLEQAAGLELNLESSHVMLCGNPQMVEDTRNALKARGLTMNRRGEGNVAVENYW
ncbi:ferredoxin--NADP reductase [Alkanindiges sp. WGS2144]|uniref:ferredoxin--NADP reductase n=1 Tax=Alkanindiges sp. WGS2144 TaxID=3366808 RepID=UPI003751D70B